MSQGEVLIWTIELRSEGIIEPRLFQPKDHVELGEKLGESDFDSAVKISGARFVVLRGQLAPGKGQLILC